MTAERSEQEPEQAGVPEAETAGRVPVEDQPAGQQSAELRRYDETASAFVERFAADMTEAGMQRMASRVFACLLSSDEGSLSSAQLSERLRISAAAVSGAVRYLSQVHMVSREREPGSRRELYRVHENIWYEALVDRGQTLTRWAKTLRAGESSLGADTPAGQRIRDTYDFLEFMRQELSQMLGRWYAHRASRDAREAPRDG